MQEERLEKLRQRRDQLSAAGMPRIPLEDELDAEIAEAEGAALLGSGAPRIDTRIDEGATERLEGSQARAYVAVWLRQGPAGINARQVLTDARRGTHAALTRLRLACLNLRSSVTAHARMSVAPRRPGRVRPRARRGPARAAPARPRLDLRGVCGIGLTDAYLSGVPLANVPEPGGLPAVG